MNGIRARLSQWCEGMQPMLMFILRLLLIVAVAALPMILRIRAVYYNFIVYDESALSLEIANDMTAISYFVAPLLLVLGKYLILGHRRHILREKCTGSAAMCWIGC